MTKQEALFLFCCMLMTVPIWILMMQLHFSENGLMLWRGKKAMDKEECTCEYCEHDRRMGIKPPAEGTLAWQKWMQKHHPGEWAEGKAEWRGEI